MVFDNERTEPPRMLQTAGIDSGFDRAVEEHWVQVQRVAWVALLLFVIAGLAGVFGRGPLSTARAQTSDRSAQITYERFARFRTPASTIVTLTGGGAPRDLRIAVSNTLLTALPIQTIVPRPARSYTTAAGTVFVFRAADTQQSAIVQFTQQPASIGVVSGDLRVGDASPVAVKTVVYP